VCCPHHSPGVGEHLILSRVDPHKVSQSGHGGGWGTNDRASSLNQGSGGGTGLRDRSTTVDGRSEKAHVSERVEFVPLKIELIPRSHGISNSSVMEVFILRTLEGHICRACN